MNEILDMKRAFSTGDIYQELALRVAQCDLLPRVGDPPELCALLRARTRKAQEAIVFSDQRIESLRQRVLLRTGHVVEDAGHQ